MIVGNDKVIDTLRFNKRTAWKIKRSENTEGIVESYGETLSNEEAILQLEQALPMLSPGRYFIEMWKPPDKRNWLKDIIYIHGARPDGSVSMPQINGLSNLPAQPALTPERIGLIATEAVEKYKREEYYKQLEEENRELKDNQDSMLMRWAERLEPYADTLLGAIFGPPKKAAIGGIPAQRTPVIKKNPKPETTDDMNEQLNTRVSNAIEEWYNIDPDAIEILEKIVKLAKTDPTKYNMAKKLL